MHIQQMTEIFHNDLGYTNVILLLMDGAKPSFEDGLYDMLAQMTAIFGDDWWDYIMVGVSKWHFDSSSVNKRTSDCEVYGENSNNCKNEAWFMAEAQLQLRDKFINTHTRNISTIFIDSLSQSSKTNRKDTLQQEEWKNATNQGMF